MRTQHRWLAIVVCALSTVSAFGQPTTSPACHDPASHSTGTTRPAAPSPAADAAFGRGGDAFNAGDYERAAREWRVSTEGYHQSGDWPRECESARRLAVAYQMLGNYRLAMDILCPGREGARGRDDRQFMLFSAAMGRTLCFTRSHHDPDGDPEVYLKEALATANELNDAATEAAVLNDLGNLYGAQQQLDKAQQAFDQCVQIAEQSGDIQTAARARCNAALMLVKANRDPSSAIDSAVQAVDRLPDSVAKASLLVTLARCMDESGGGERAEQTYRSAIELATKLKDDRIEAFAWGYLGGHFEKLGKFDDAIAATRRARFISQKLQRDDSLYRWEWQLGRLYEARGDLDAAAKAYQRAVDGLSSGNVRDDVALSYAAPIATGQFRQEVGRLYYGLADLLLRQCDNEPDPAKVQQRLRAARSTIERFKTAELKNYFQDDCLKLSEATEQDIDKALATDRTTAIIYLIPLADRTELLLSLPGEGSNSSQPQLWRAPKVPVGAAELSKLVFDFRDLITLQNDYGYKDSAARFYDLLIRPIDQMLKQRGITTLVFVPDGDLRSVAPAAFYDRARDRYLVEDYALAITPGLSLSAPSPIGGGAARNVRVLAGGLSEQKTVSVAGETVTYRKLDKVADELRDVEAVYGSQHSRMLENDQFVKQNIGKALDQTTYPVVHLATHANFDKDVRKTYVVTADARPIDLSQLEQLIQPSQFRGQPVELLSLSACETASGDEGRSALGLAGVAVRAGARSALATLWLADDEATAKLIPIFYRDLNASASVTKAQALQRAQVKMLHNDDKLLRHPKLWAQFVIVGNWR